jgi:Ran GTPase-activating protein (RanGAP) involved in mRNA processing and transport
MATVATRHRSPRSSPCRPIVGFGCGRTMATTTDALISLLRSIRCQDPNVQRVVLEQKELPASYLRTLLHAVGESKYVSSLKLSRVGAGDCIAEALANCLRNSVSLVDVDLSKNRLSNYSCSAIASALIETGRGCPIRRLHLESNHIEDEGIQQLCEAIPTTNIATLKLGKNQFGLQGLRSIADLLIRSKSPLTSLDLRSNSIGNTGASILADALAFSTTHMQHLYLNGNDLDNTGAERLAASLVRNQHLRTLDLRHNHHVNDQGAAAFVKALQHNDFFTKLKIRNTAVVSEDLKSALLELLLMNSYGPDLARRTKQAAAAMFVGSDQIFRDVSDCVICFEKLSDCALLPCQHCNCCRDCGQRLKHCHMCRSPIVKILSLDPSKIPAAFC